ncbi:MAG: hypothetical protein AAFP19_22425 [Bacteroidota bacterium]
MKKLVFLLSLPFLLMALNVPVDFDLEFREAMDFIHQNQRTIHQVAKQFDGPQEEALAVVAPELLRYNLFRDLLETTALELAYVQYGAEVADFSIGPFQMKPSFTASVEEFVLADEQLKKCYGDAILRIPFHHKAIRQARLDFMESLEGQLYYAFLFAQMMSEGHDESQFTSHKDKLSYWATAYNCGHTRPTSELMQCMHQPVFPYGADFDIVQYSYAAWSQLFYQHLLKKP